MAGLAMRQPGVPSMFDSFECESSDPVHAQEGGIIQIIETEA